jgi:hypothetical protein
MIELHGKRWTRRELAAHAGQLAQFAGVQLMTLEDGAERGVRCLEFRSGTGLRFVVLVDRCFDVGTFEYRGAALGWNSPTGFRNPMLHETSDEDDMGWLRSFSGLHVTCGLDHTLSAEEEPADHFGYPPRKTIRSPLHGRIAHTPARLVGYGQDWRGDDCVLWAEGEVRQAAVFAEHLVLRRRIEVRLGTNEVTIADKVVNEGFSKTPHMLMYHINLGHPLLDEGSRYLAPVRHTRWASHAEDLRRQGVGSVVQGGPSATFVEQVFEHAMGADDDGQVPVALINPKFDRGRGLGLGVITRLQEFPCHIQWQNYRSGLYTMGIEPSTHHALGKRFARERGELTWLEPGEERRYGVTYQVLDGASDIEAFSARVAAIGAPPQVDYSAPTGRWDD